MSAAIVRIELDDGYGEATKRERQAMAKLRLRIYEARVRDRLSPPPGERIYEPADVPGELACQLCLHRVSPSELVEHEASERHTRALAKVTK